MEKRWPKGFKGRSTLAGCILAILELLNLVARSGHVD